MLVGQAASGDVVEARCNVAHLFVDELRDARSELFIFILDLLLLDADRLNQLQRVVELVAHGVRRGCGLSTRSLLHHSLVVELFVCEGQLFFLSRNLLHELGLVKGLLGDHLATQVLNLVIQSLLDCVVFLTHDLPPDRVQLVKDLTDARLIHFAMVLVSDLQNYTNCLGWDPIVVFGLFCTLDTIALSRLIHGPPATRLGGYSRATGLHGGAHCHILNLVVIKVTILSGLF